MLDHGTRWRATPRRAGRGSEPSRVPVQRAAVVGGESDPVDRTEPERSVERNVLIGVVLALWLAVVALGRAWGLALQGEGRRITLFTPPVLGGYRPAVPDRFWLAAGVAALVVVGAPVVTARLRWWPLLGAGVASASAWWAALASLDGNEGFTKGLEWKVQWAPYVHRASDDPAGVLRNFVADLPSSSIQVRGHPPGFLVLAGLLDRVGLASEATVAAMLFTAGLSALVAIALTVRLLVGERAARRVLPYLVLAPAATWLVMSLDTLYVAVAAWLVFVLVQADRVGRRSRLVLAVAAGALAAIAAMLSYGLVLLAWTVAAVMVAQRSWRVLAVATGTAAAIVVALVPLGFWWFAGLAATRHEYEILDVDRPYDYFAVNNLSAWALVIGPSVAVGIALLRDRRAWLLVGGALAAIATANLSGLSEGEVERIWLPFSMWVFVAALALPAGRFATRGFLALQAGSALALNAVIGTYW